MPDYLAPGVYIEENLQHSRSIEGVDTRTSLFVGPARTGPVGTGDASGSSAQPLTSFADFERIHGGLSDLQFADGPMTNYLAHAARAYFDEGGSRLHVLRVAVVSKVAGDGGATHACVVLRAGEDEDAVAFDARFPGAGGNGTVSVIETATPASRGALDAAPDGSWLRTVSGDVVADHLKLDGAWRSLAAVDADPDAETDAADADRLAEAQPRLLTLAIIARDADGGPLAWEGLGYDRRHPRWAGALPADLPVQNAGRLQNPFVLRIGERVDAATLRDALFGDAADHAAAQPRREWTLAGGSDGRAPQAADYAAALRDARVLADASTLAAPGATAYGDELNAIAVMRALVDHASQPRAWCMAVLDPPPGLGISQVRELRGRLDSRHAALYYPWVVVADPQALPGNDGVPSPLLLPPSGFICGIYARTDVERGVHKSPANEVVRSAIGFESKVNLAQQDVLNPEGVNCLRTFDGRGHRVWGARTMSSDPEWKYVPVRRYFDYLEKSIDRGTQWAVFEPYGERLWAGLRGQIGDFLNNEWRNGALLGTTPDQAYFVRCDRSTMSQDDLDQGRVVCLVGVSLIRPAEFMVLRIGQTTAAA